MSEPTSRSQQKRIAIQTKKPDPFAAVKQVLQKNCITNYEQKAAEAEIKQAEGREAKWRELLELVKEYQSHIVAAYSKFPPDIVDLMNRTEAAIADCAKTGG